MHQGREEEGTEGGQRKTTEERKEGERRKDEGSTEDLSFSVLLGVRATPQSYPTLPSQPSRTSRAAPGSLMLKYSSSAPTAADGQTHQNISESPLTSAH